MNNTVIGNEARRLPVACLCRLSLLDWPTTSVGELGPRPDRPSSTHNRYTQTVCALSGRCRVWYRRDNDRSEFRPSDELDPRPGGARSMAAIRTSRWLGIETDLLGRPRIGRRQGRHRRVRGRGVVLRRLRSLTSTGEMSQVAGTRVVLRSDSLPRSRYRWRLLRHTVGFAIRGVIPDGSRPGVHFRLPIGIESTACTRSRIEPREERAMRRLDTLPQARVCDQ